MDGLQCFLSRFHRPPAGLGLKRYSINSIKTIRKIEEYVKMWEIVPRMDLLPDAEGNHAYLSAKEGEKYVVYFTRSGRVNLDLINHPGEFTVLWISSDDAEWGRTEKVRGGGVVELNSNGAKSCFAVLLRK